MPESTDVLQQIFQHYGLVGLAIGFLILGPGFTYFRTRTIRTQSEAKAQSLVNEFAQKERERSERLEERLNTTLQKLNNAEDEVSRLRTRLAKAQADLDEVQKLKQHIRRLIKKVRGLETAINTKQSEIDHLRQQLQQREPQSNSDDQK